MSFEKFRKECNNLLNLIDKNYSKLLEIPPKERDSDLALPCFFLAKEFKKPPEEIAKTLESRIKIPGKSSIKEIRVEGPYLNFYADWKKLGRDIILESLKKTYGKGREKNTVMVEYSSPNTNKPLHVGHLRNDSIGMSVSNIIEFMGNSVIRTEIINDRGVHICKSMLAYKKWGGDSPEKTGKKSDHFVGDYYVLFEKKIKENKDLEKEIHDMLKKWEQGDKETISLWKKMNSWVLEGMKKTYAAFGSKFDFVTHESDIYDKAKDMLKEGEERKIFLKNEKGDMVAKLEPELPDKVVLRSDGTSVYITQDMALAKMRFEKYKIDKLVYVVATEQNLHFRHLFKILEKLGYGWADNCHHLGYGLVNLPSGRMKTREGTVVDADELIEDLRILAEKEIIKRENVGKKELKSRSLTVALAAIKYFMLKVEPQKDILFDPSKAISFEGDSGPYIQYTYARASSILRKSRKKYKTGNIGVSEIPIVKKISAFPEIVSRSYTELKPNIIANYLSELSAIFNSYYHENKVIGSENEESKLALVAAVRNVTGIGLNLLGIKPLEKM